MIPAQFDLKRASSAAEAISLIGESGTIGSTPAVQSAVIDALAHLGVRHIDMPTTAERVWTEIQKQKAQGNS